MTYARKHHLAGQQEVCGSSAGLLPPILVSRDEFVRLPPTLQCGICRRKAGMPLVDIYPKTTERQPL